ncbi:MAG: magnesium transporter CorA family protein [Clostridia bacterium]|nr:magnesium transporter CorA family protein [Clostridia bacterium]
MISFYKTEEKKIVQLSERQDGCWINVTDPTEAELDELANGLGIEEDFLRAALDEEESSRIDAEDGTVLVIVDIPRVEREGEAVIYSTMPFGIIFAPNNVVTVCLKENTIIREFANGCAKQFKTEFKTQFAFNLLYTIANRYLQYLKQIDKISSHVEKKLHVSMKNSELIQLLDLEKSLVYFSTSLKGNQVTLQKLMRGKFIKMYEEDQELMEDVLIEVRQAIEMSEIYSSILSGTMDAFASIISNNLNNVMKVLTSMSIILTIPTMIASFYGMNVSGLPIPSFWFPVGLSLLVTIGVAVFLKIKGLLK